MKKIFQILSLVLLITLLTGCGIKDTEDIPDPDSEVVDREVQPNTSCVNSTSLTEPPAAESVTDELVEELKVPEPDSLNSVQWECGTYYSDISAENLQAYFQKLKEEGWKDYNGDELTTEFADGISEYMLIREDDLLQILVYLMDRTQAISNSILVRKDSNLPINNISLRKSAITKAEALEEIHQYIDRVQNTEEFPYAVEKLVGVFEIFIEDAYDKMEIQAYAAVSDSGVYGCFLIRKGIVSYVGGELKNAYVADIDSDGKYELLDLYTAWENGISKIHLNAYWYINPVDFNSLTEILQIKYSNCFVPQVEYTDLFLKKSDDQTFNLISSNKDYGPITIEGAMLVVDHMENFPFDEWSKYYNQDILKDFDKVIPASPPDIVITVDKTELKYTVRQTNWNGTANAYPIADAFKEITAKNQFIPTFKLSSRIEDNYPIPVVMDFGESIPDSILIYDAMLDTDGSCRYGEELIQKQCFKIIDQSHIQFALKQHMTYYLSSNTGDYNRDWYRLFRVVCSWGDNDCTYAFLINTGNTEKLYE